MIPAMDKSGSNPNSAVKPPVAKNKGAQARFKKKLQIGNWIAQLTNKPNAPRGAICGSSMCASHC